jgi:hypothetical protein
VGTNNSGTNEHILFIIALAFVKYILSGKIDKDGAAAQALQKLSERLSSSNNLTAATEGFTQPVDGKEEEERFDLVLTARGNIRLETMSWIEAVRRKYGFMDETQGTVPSGRPGRTASAGSKAAKINPALKEDTSDHI